jgi:hypothetical protein
MTRIPGVYRTLLVVVESTSKTKIGVSTKAGQLHQLADHTSIREPIQSGLLRPTQLYYR